MLTSLRSPSEIGGTKCIIEALFFPRIMQHTSFLIFAHLLWLGGWCFEVRGYDWGLWGWKFQLVGPRASGVGPSGLFWGWERTLHNQVFINSLVLLH